MNISQLIDNLGDAFRGLWKSRHCELGNDNIEEGFSVTFILNGEYMETQYCNTPKEALEFAVKKLGEGE